MLGAKSKNNRKKLEQAIDRSNESKVKNQLKATEAMLLKVSITRQAKEGREAGYT